MSELSATGLALQAIRDEIIEQCAKEIERVWPLNDFPSACENSDVYRSQDAAVRTVLQAVRRMKARP